MPVPRLTRRLAPAGAQTAAPPRNRSPGQSRVCAPGGGPGLGVAPAGAQPMARAATWPAVSRLPPESSGSAAQQGSGVAGGPCRNVPPVTTANRGDFWSSQNRTNSTNRRPKLAPVSRTTPDATQGPPWPPIPASAGGRSASRIVSAGLPPARRRAPRRPRPHHPLVGAMRQSRETARYTQHGACRCPPLGVPPQQTRHPAARAARPASLLLLSRGGGEQRGSTRNSPALSNGESEHYRPRPPVGVGVEALCSRWAGTVVALRALRRVVSPFG